VQVAAADAADDLDHVKLSVADAILKVALQSWAPLRGAARMLSDLHDAAHKPARS
jgi:hypothetical protein